MADPPSPAPASALFSLFSNLPTEIRIKIWQHAALQPRVVEFSAKVPLDDRLGQQQYLRYLKRQESNNRALGTGHRSDVTWQTTITQPAILSVSREAREIALEVYTLPFDLAGTYHSSHIAYLNPWLDTIYCNMYSSLLVHYLLNDLQSCDNEGDGAKLLALNEKCFAESLVCRPPDGLRGSKYMERLEALVLITEMDVGREEDAIWVRREWRLVECTYSPAKEINFQARVGRKPRQFFDVALRGVEAGLRPDFRLCALRREGTVMECSQGLSGLCEPIRGRRAGKKS